MWLGLLTLPACGNDAAGPPPSPLGAREHPPLAAPAQTEGAAPDIGPAAPAAPAASGVRLTGRVRFLGTAPARQPVLVVKDRECCGTPAPLDERLVVSADGGVRDAVVELCGVPRSAAHTLPGPFTLTQHGCTYTPHVLVVPVGTPVEIQNADPIMHNVHSFCRRNEAVNRAQGGGSDPMALTFARAERVRLRCDLHGWMSAWVVVAAHPWFACTDAQGRFSLDGVPPGTYTVRCWQERLGECECTVTVPAGHAGPPVAIAYPADALDAGGR